MDVGEVSWVDSFLGLRPDSNVFVEEGYLNDSLQEISTKLPQTGNSLRFFFFFNVV